MVFVSKNAADMFCNFKNYLALVYILKLETNFHGGNHVPSEINSTVVRCKVKFAGPNVLEGLKNLAAAGVADVPMKDHLSRIKSLARNKFRFVPRVNCTQP